MKYLYGVPSSMIGCSRMILAMAVLCMAVGLPCVGAMFYVDASRPDDSGDGSTWVTAKKTIQAAIDAAADTDTILVTNGVYDLGGEFADGVTNRVYLDKALVLSAVSTNPADTLITGAPDGIAGDGTGAGPNAVRCVRITADAFFTGFTVSNGYTLHTGSTATRTGDGGGILASGCSATISNCVIRNNYAAHRGGGVYDGTYFDCMIKTNRAGDSATAGHRGTGGAHAATLYRCTLSGNGAGYNVTAARSCDMYDCIVQSNTLEYSVLYDCNVYDSIIRGNKMSSPLCSYYRCSIRDNIAGGTTPMADYFESCRIFCNYGGHYSVRMAQGTFINSLIYLNTNFVHTTGGNLLSGSFLNCTIVSNSMRWSAVAISTTGCTNSIVRDNYSSHRPAEADFAADVTNVAYTCTPVVTGFIGAGNITNDPMFLVEGAMNYRLQRLSSCVDSGQDVSGSGLTNDIDNIARPLDGNGDGSAEYDIGCSEYVLPPHGTIFFGW